MPYIKKGDGRREALQSGDTALTAGELNYQMFYYVKHQQINHVSMDLTAKIKECVDNFLGEKPNYQKYNDMTGALVRCGFELKRRGVIENPGFLIDILMSYNDTIDKYEDLKIEENGDVE
jgi:hypothetical protein